MEGNLNPNYQLRLDRLRRVRERFRRGEIHEKEFRDLLSAEGIISHFAQDIEIRENGLETAGG
jgi:hypothetical protein